MEDTSNIIDTPTTLINYAIANKFIVLSVLTAIVLVVAIVCLVIYLLLKDKNIQTKFFSTSQKAQVQAESRELSDNQMRAGKIIIRHIKVLFTNASNEMFPEFNSFEKDYIDLLTDHIIDNLIDHFRIDLVRNHITSKTDDELKIYARSKADIYYQKVEIYINQYNRTFPNHDLIKILHRIPKETFCEIYLKAYDNAKKLSVGY